MGEMAVFEGGHDGYARFRPPVIHWRRIYCLPTKVWVVIDGIEGEGQGQVKNFLHLHPAIHISERGGRFVLSGEGGLKSLILLLLPGRAKIAKSWHCPTFGERQASELIIFEEKGDLPIVMGYAICGEEVPVEPSIEDDFLVLKYHDGWTKIPFKFWR